MEKLRMGDKNSPKPPKVEYTMNSYGRRELSRIDKLDVDHDLDRFAEDLIEYAKHPDNEKDAEWINEQSSRIAEEISKESQGLEMRATAAEIKAGLYIGFREESDRQKTKMGGFKGYVQRFIDDMRSERTEASTEAEQKLESMLLEDTVRSNLGGRDSEGNNDYEGRENYKRQAAELREKIKNLENRKLVLQKIFSLAISKVPEKKLQY